ncbi:MAG: hemerythrin domain-containing protein [Proteobacteria bacterium]|nr:hemerythrin domain-containing protein [Pseudomonadota bacterium]
MRLLERHMEAVLLLDFSRASELLRHFGHEMRRHIEAEETVILPVFGDRAGPVPGCTSDVFLAEHRKMLSMIDDGLAVLSTKSPTPREALTYLDKAFTLKHLVEHHDRREENLLYPWMDRITTSGERGALLRRFIEMNGPLLEPYAVSETAQPPQCPLVGPS